MLIGERPRRLRRTRWIRDLVAEHGLCRSDLIWPLFVHDGRGSEQIGAMPGVSRLDAASLLGSCERAARLGLPAVALFPRVDDRLRCAGGVEAHNDSGLLQRSVRAVKREFPDLGVVADVALDPYTSHGHDGVLDDSGAVDNDRTVAALVRQALSLAAAGADILAPSDMMDGRIGEIRTHLERHGHTGVALLSYAVKYASCLYEPFREAVGSGQRLKGDKLGYQMNPANALEARREARLDEEQGADMLMVKPGLPCLDVIRDLSSRSSLPVLAYQVSGEYAMIEAAASRGWLDGEAAMLEALLCFKRAGARAVLSYHAERAARALP